MITIKLWDINVLTVTESRGKLLERSEEKFLVDFSEDVKQYNLVGSPKDYSRVLVNKSQCVKEKRAE